jgi:alkanesulfonate monooxygenase SsuD/methylene tetrahydromethanopterin reductase-like flavin-dependent oxidoreductase (luciferase family)
MMHLGFSLSPFGHDPSAWKASATREPLGFDGLLKQVVRAEQAGFDFVLLANQQGRRPNDTLSPLATPFEPTTLVSALATRARKIGFIAAAATYQHEPYNLARRLASIDSISGGRTGWAIVSGDDLSRDREYVDVVSALWDSWEDDAFIYDKAKGRFFVPDKMHVLNHKGDNFSVRGPLNVNRSPQGKPVLAAYAGSPVADRGEVVFAPDMAAARHVATQRGQGRSDIRILAEVTDFTGSPADIADRLQRDFESGDVDGFILAPPTTAAFLSFVVSVAPLLQRRGLIRTNYAGSTLREHLGLPRPAHPAGLERAS